MATSNALLTINNAPYVTVKWPAMAASDVGSGVDMGQAGEISVYAVGDATTVSMEGSNDGGTTWATLGAGVTLTIATGKTPVTRIAEHPGLIRPNVTGGTSTAVWLVYGRKGG